MSVSVVERVHVRCRGPRSREQAALALRSRLAQTARLHLPAALEQRLGGRERRTFVERVEHRLAFDPGLYDDVTVATLWADAIARELEEAGMTEARGVRSFADDAVFAAAAALEIARRGELPWWFSELACGAGRVPVRQVLAALEAPERARAALAALARETSAALSLARRLEPYERSLLALVLAGELPWQALGLSATAARAAVVAVSGAAAPALADPPMSEAETVGTSSEPAAGRSRPRRPARAPRAYVPASAPSPAELAALIGRAGSTGFAQLGFERSGTAPRPRRRPDAREAERAAPPAPGEAEELADAARRDGRPRPGSFEESLPARQGWWTAAAGLVYLYPWLGDLLDDREELERVQLLGALVEPGADDRLRDPFVRLLAGIEPGAEREPPTAAREPIRATQEDAAAAVLGTFAAALPGFEGSTPAFLRAHVVCRAGLLEPHPDGYRLVLEPAPLDPVLVRLPYPLAPFRLPWAPLVLPERRRA